MTPETLWIVLAVVVAIVLVAVGAGLLLRRRRTISLRLARELEERERPGTAPPRRGGSYRAETGFSFTSGTDTAAGPDTGTAGPDTAPPPAPPRPRHGDVTLPDAPLPTPDAAPATDTAPVADAPPVTPDERGPAVDARPVDGVAVARPTAPPAPDTTEAPAPTSGSSATEAPTSDVPPALEAPPRRLEGVPAAPAGPDAAPAAVTEDIAPAQGRLERLRGRLARSRTGFGQGLLGLLGAGELDEESWEDVEATLLQADLGPEMTSELVETLREQLAVRAVRTPEQVRALLREVLTDALRPDLDRAVRALPHDGRPAVLLIVGVNGTGKTTTTGKLARVLVASGRRVVLGAADTFRAAAAEQLTTWGERAGATVVRGPEGADPASVAFDAVKQGAEEGADAVLLDTAGRLHTKTGLMDELQKVKRVVERQAEVDEVLLVLDATTGQNGLTQARVFGDVVKVTGIVLTKLDGTAKGGIVFRVQRELGVPVKLVGLGEGADDLAPFEPGAYVDALLT